LDASPQDGVGGYWYEASGRQNSKIIFETEICDAKGEKREYLWSAYILMAGLPVGTENGGKEEDTIAATFTRNIGQT
jgi:hypothetical protein